MKNKNIIINYCQAWNPETGTHYTQQIKIDINTMVAFNNYIREKQKEIERAFKKRHTYTNEDMKIKSITPLKTGVNYTNLIYLDMFISFYIKTLYTPPKKDKTLERILDRNTLIIVI